MSDQRYSWIALDLDDTLLGPDRAVGYNARRAVQLVQGCEKVAILATGRPYASAKKFARELNLLGPVVANSGAVIRDPAGGVLRDLYLDPELVTRVLSEISARELVAYVYHGEHTVATADHRDTERYSRVLRIDIPVVPNPEPEGVHAISVRVPPEIGARLERELREEFADIARVLRTLDTLIEILPRGAGKGAALRYLSCSLGLPLEELVAVGDSAGDMDMLEVAGRGVLVANAPRHLRGRADHVTREPYDEGVLRVVCDLLCEQSAI
ncbi:MAG: HAD family hydrolase [Bacillota bacterium]